jgi:hypothetical protein
MKLTEEALRDARTKLNNETSGIAEGNQLFGINQQIDALEWLFDAFNKSGEFVDEEQTGRRGGWNVAEKNAQEKKAQADDVFYARVVVARAGLRLLHKAIPALQEISTRCLEVAGKAAILQACTPDRMEGTDLNGQPYRQPTPEFTLPEGYGTITAKIKSAIGI